MTVDAERFLTGLEPHPLGRYVSPELSATIDVVIAEADDVLAQSLKPPARITWFQPISIALFYADNCYDGQEHTINELEPSGWQVCYMGYEASPTVLCYDYETVVSWKGSQVMAAETLRVKAKLRRYSLYTCINNTWRFQHAGQLPLSPCTKKRY